MIVACNSSKVHNEKSFTKAKKLSSKIADEQNIPVFAYYGTYNPQQLVWYHSPDGIVRTIVYSNSTKKRVLTSANYEVNNTVLDSFFADENFRSYKGNYSCFAPQLDGNFIEIRSKAKVYNLFIDLDCFIKNKYEKKSFLYNLQMDLCIIFGLNDKFKELYK